MSGSSIKRASSIDKMSGPIYKLDKLACLKLPCVQQQTHTVIKKSVSEFDTSPPAVDTQIDTDFWVLYP